MRLVVARLLSMSIVRHTSYFRRAEVSELAVGEEIMTLPLLVLIQYQSVTDGRTDIAVLPRW